MADSRVNGKDVPHYLLAADRCLTVAARGVDIVSPSESLLAKSRLALRLAEANLRAAEVLLDFRRYQDGRSLL